MAISQRNKVLTITAVIGILAVSTILITPLMKPRADQKFPIIYTQLRTKVDGFGPMTNNAVHPCNAKVPAEKMTFYGITVNPPVTIMAHDFGGGGDLKVYENVNTIYVTVKTPEEGRWLAIFDSKSPATWQYLTAEKACIDFPDPKHPLQEHLLLRDFGPAPTQQ